MTFIFAEVLEKIVVPQYFLNVMLGGFFYAHETINAKGAV